MWSVDYELPLLFKTSLDNYRIHSSFPMSERVIALRSMAIVFTRAGKFRTKAHNECIPIILEFY